MANNLEDQEQAVVPAAVTEGKPDEKPADLNGDGMVALETAPPEAKAADEKAPESIEKPADKAKTDGESSASGTECSPAAKIGRTQRER